MTMYTVPNGISAYTAQDIAGGMTVTAWANNIYDVGGSNVATWAARVGATIPTQDQINLATCPQTVSAVQARIAMANTTLPGQSQTVLAQVTAFMATASQQYQLAWEYATEFSVSSPTLQAIATVLSMTTAQIAQLMATAEAVIV